ncbi:chl4 family chromosome segregation [Colletotrichum camelliae]|nr:chl4 family chromosome segregation [Colletotrichum camelliae]
MARFSIPTKRALSSDVRLPTSSAAVQKALTRLSRPSILTLALDWISDENVSLCVPLLGDDVDKDGLYQPAKSLEELRTVYKDWQCRNGSKREVLDRVTEGDWQHGLTLYQLAMADAQYLQDHPTSQRWTAYRILPLKDVSSVDDEQQPPDLDRESLKLPRFHPSTFIQNLQSHVLPDVKAHYHIHRPQGLAMSVLRIFIIESPYNTSMAQLGDSLAPPDSDVDCSRTLYLAFPDASHYIYLSKSQTIGPLGAAESKSFRNLVIEGIPKALSRPRERYFLKPMNVSTKNISALLQARGVGRANAAGGGWNIYGDKKKNESPLDNTLPTPPLSEESSDDSLDPTERTANKRNGDTLYGSHCSLKRARLFAQARFGSTARLDDGVGIERVDVAIEDSFPVRRQYGVDDEEMTSHISNNEGSGWIPNVKVTLHGAHVFAGVRRLVENGIVEGQRMPGWLTGEEGVTLGAVRHGRIRGHRGSGL